MSISVRTRFEVLKRDRYTCTYCGKHPPDVLLEIDHVLPRAAGGTDNIENLRTACVDCNRGKGGRMLEEGTGPGIHPDSVAAMQERLAQTRAYMEITRDLQSMQGEMIDEVFREWARAFHAREGDGGSLILPNSGRWPEESAVRRFVRSLPLDRVIEAVDRAASRFQGWASADAVRYFYGTGHGMIRDLKGTEHPAVDEEAIEEWAYQRGREAATAEIGALLRNYPEHGWATLEDAVLGLFPDED